jgi:hypothetical protein
MGPPFDGGPTCVNAACAPILRLQRGLDHAVLLEVEELVDDAEKRAALSDGPLRQAERRVR